MTVRIGIVGLGNIGQMHAAHLTANSGKWGCELAGGMDISPVARRRFADEYGVTTYEDEAALYADCDAILVTTPNRYHESYAVSALESGLDVLLEKPLAHELGSAKRIAAAAEQSEGFCMVGFQSRFNPGVEVLRAYQSEGRLGEVYHVEANYLRRRGIPGRGSWFTDRDMAGGGALIDVGVHALDLALHVLDFPEVVEVAGTTRSQLGNRDDYAYLHMWGDDGDGEFDVDDSVTAFVRCAGGQTVSLEVAWAANRPPNHELIVRGTEAGATFDLTSGDLTLYQSLKTGGDHHATTDVDVSEQNAHKVEKRRFVDAVRAGEPPEQSTVEEALTVQRVVDAIYRSSETGHAVTVDDG